MNQAPSPYGPPYQQTTTVVVADRTTNGLAIAALVLGLCGFAVVPVILGHLALRQINRGQQSGYGLAVAGLVLGYLQTAIFLLAGGAWALFGQG